MPAARKSPDLVPIIMWNFRVSYLQNIDEIIYKLLNHGH